MQNEKTPSSLGANTDKKILELCEREGKLNAIKYCKELTGWELKTAKEYIESLEIANAGTKGKPFVIDRSGLRGCMFIPGLIFSAIWITLSAVIPLHYMDDSDFSTRETWMKPLMYGVFGLMSLPGFIFLIWAARMEYDEKISITAREVSYFKKGWLRKTQQWEEPILNYKGVASITEDGTEDSIIYVVKLKHQFDKKKDIVLKESAPDKQEQSRIRDEYSKFLKLPAINESA